jgi:hypothetical protein
MRNYMLAQKDADKYMHKNQILSVFNRRFEDKLKKRSFCAADEIKTTCKASKHSTHM